MTSVNALKEEPMYQNQELTVSFEVVLGTE